MCTPQCYTFHKHKINTLKVKWPKQTKTFFLGGGTLNIFFKITEDTIGCLS